MSGYIVHKAIEASSLSDKRRRELESSGNTYVISPKYDGCHAVFCFDDGKHVATYSRSGEVVRSMDHIARSLLDLYPIQVGRVAIQGEAWIVGKEFNEVSGTFRRHAPQPELQFVPFDIVPFDYNDDTTSGAPVLLGQLNHRLYSAPYWLRLSSLDDARRDIVSNVLRPRYWSATGTLSEVMALADVYAKDHKARTDSYFDGAVMALSEGRYSVGSGKGGEFLKVKPLLSYTVTVTGYFQAAGAKTGKNTGGLFFELNGHEQRVSTGLRQDQLDALSHLVGHRMEVEAMGLTVNGLLREPRFKGIRTDA